MSYVREPGEPQERATSAGVGEVLRRAREHYGIDIERVAEALKIRPAYLEAIEESRFEELPGATYALGFVRTYADYLGLDSARVVRRFRQETLGAAPPVELSFPTPQRERHVPGGALVMLSLVLAGIAYGAWYTLSERDRVVVEAVPPVPRQLVAEADPAPVADARVAVAAPADAGPAGSAPTQGAAATGVTAPAAPPPSAAPGAPPAAPAPSQPGAAAAAPDAGPAGPQGMPRAVIVPAPAIPGVQLASTPATETASAPPPPWAQGQVYGAANQDSRVTLLARLESWVRVTDRNQKTVWTRVLREGESYLVPNEPGLLLTTGNAGGLQIFVDGKPVPPIGGVGAVTRNVPLDPETLLASAGGPTVE